MNSEVKVSYYFFARYDANEFCSNLRKFVSIRQKKGKPDKSIRYSSYCIWALELRKNGVGDKGKTYTFPGVVLNFIRKLAPTDINGAIHEDAFVISLQDFGQYIS